MTFIAVVVLHVPGEIAFARTTNGPLPLEPVLLPGERPDHMPARPPSAFGRADTIFFGYYQEIGGGIYAVQGETWTFDHGAPDPFEGWHAVDLTDDDVLVARHITQEIWSSDPDNPPVAPVISGLGSAWIGLFEGEADALCWAAGLGYDNYWCQRLVGPALTYAGSGSVFLEFAYFNDTDVAIGAFFHTNQEPQCTRLRGAANDWGVPADCDLVRFGIEIYSSCDAFSIPPNLCTGVTNATPLIDNVRIGMTYRPNAPAVSIMAGGMFQDGFSQSYNLGAFDACRPQAVGRSRVRLLAGPRLGWPRDRRPRRFVHLRLDGLDGNRHSGAPLSLREPVSRDGRRLHASGAGGSERDHPGRDSRTGDAGRVLRHLVLHLFARHPLLSAGHHRRRLPRVRDPSKLPRGRRRSPAPGSPLCGRLQPRQPGADRGRAQPDPPRGRAWRSDPGPAVVGPVRLPRRGVELERPAVPLVGQQQRRRARAHARIPHGHPRHRHPGR